MSKWIELNPEEINSWHTEKINGIEVRVQVPQHDVPEAVRGRYDNTTRRFVIDFKYSWSDPESKQPFSNDDHVKLFIGEISKRIYSIHVDVDGIGVTSVKLSLEAVNRTIDRLATSTKKRSPSRAGNYRITQEAIRQRGDDLAVGMSAQASAS